MTKEQAKEMLQAKLECLENTTSPKPCDCECIECDLEYRQGNMGEQKQALDMAIKALEQQPIAEERYQDLVKYFGDKNVAKCILEDREEFKKWLERIKWHVCKADELARKLEQQSEDCVSRAEMLKYQQYLRGKMSNEENHKLWEFIKALPSVTPTQRWIPVSKTTQPKENEAVLITYKFSGKRITTKAYRQSNGWQFENGGWIPNELVIAWQPLPKPYEEKRGNENV